MNRYFGVSAPLLLAALSCCIPPHPAAGGEKLQVLVVTGGHGYNKKVFPRLFANDNMAVRFGIEGMKGSAVFDDVQDWKYDVIVLYNFKQKIGEKQKKNFIGLVKSGNTGLVVLHHAIAAYPGWIEYEKMIGATYVLKEQVRDGVKYARPVWKHDVDIALHIEDPSHPITAGMRDFTVHDETYKKWVYHDGNHLLVSTDCALNNKQVCWVRTYGAGRVFFMQLGHGPQVFTDPHFKKLVARGIRWTAGRLKGK